MKSKVIDNFLAIFFLLLIFIIPIVGLFYSQKVLSQENRKINTFPDFSKTHSLKSYVKDFELFINDSFGFRGQFVNAYLTIKRAISKYSIAVIEGKEEWYFIKRNIKYYRGGYSYRYAKTFVDELENFIGKVNIPVYVVIVPSKPFAKEKYLPDSVQKGNLYDKTLIYMRDKNIGFLDLSTALLAEKKEIYLKTDTHWNSWGAYIAYQQIIKYINSFGNDLPITSDYKKESSSILGDLNLLRGSEEKEDFEKIILKPKLAESIVKKGEVTIVPNFRNKYKNKKAFLIHDSYGTHYLAEYLAESFAQLNTFWKYDFDKILPIVRQEKYDFVIFQVVDRHMKKR